MISSEFIRRKTDKVKSSLADKIPPKYKSIGNFRRFSSAGKSGEPSITTSPITDTNPSKPLDAFTRDSYSVAGIISDRLQEISPDQPDPTTKLKEMYAYINGSFDHQDHAGLISNAIHFLNQHKNQLPHLDDADLKQIHSELISLAASPEPVFETNPDPEFNYQPQYSTTATTPIPLGPPKPESTPVTIPVPEPTTAAIPIGLNRTSNHESSSLLDPEPAPTPTAISELQPSWLGRIKQKARDIKYSNIARGLSRTAAVGTLAFTLAACEDQGKITPQAALAPDTGKDTPGLVTSTPEHIPIPSSPSRLSNSIAGAFRTPTPTETPTPTPDKSEGPVEEFLEETIGEPIDQALPTDFPNTLDQAVENTEQNLDDLGEAAEGLAQDIGILPEEENLEDKIVNPQVVTPTIPTPTPTRTPSPTLDSSEAPVEEVIEETIGEPIDQALPPDFPDTAQEAQTDAEQTIARLWNGVQERLPSWQSVQEFFSIRPQTPVTVQPIPPTATLESTVPIEEIIQDTEEVIEAVGEEINQDTEELIDDIEDEVEETEELIEAEAEELIDDAGKQIKETAEDIGLIPESEEQPTNPVIIFPTVEPTPLPVPVTEDVEVTIDDDQVDLELNLKEESTETEILRTEEIEVTEQTTVTVTQTVPPQEINVIFLSDGREEIIRCDRSYVGYPHPDSETETYVCDIDIEPEVIVQEVEVPIVEKVEVPKPYPVPIFNWPDLSNFKLPKVIRLKPEVEIREVEVPVVEEVEVIKEVEVIEEVEVPVPEPYPVPLFNWPDLSRFKFPKIVRVPVPTIVTPEIDVREAASAEAAAEVDTPVGKTEVTAEADAAVDFELEPDGTITLEVAAEAEADVNTEETTPTPEVLPVTGAPISEGHTQSELETDQTETETVTHTIAVGETLGQIAYDNFDSYVVNGDSFKVVPIWSTIIAQTSLNNTEFDIEIPLTKIPANTTFYIPEDPQKIVENHPELVKRAIEAQGIDPDRYFTSP